MSRPEAIRQPRRNGASMAAREWARLESAYLSPVSALVLRELAEFVGPDGIARPIVSDVLARLPFGFGSYRNGVGALRKAGLIETARHGGRHHPAEYRLAVSDGDSVSGYRDTDGVSVSRPETVHKRGATRERDQCLSLSQTPDGPGALTHNAAAHNASHTCTREERAEFVDALKAAAAAHGFEWRWRGAEHSGPAAALADDCRGAGVDVEALAALTIAQMKDHGGNSWTYALDTAVSVLRKLRAAL